MIPSVYLNLEDDVTKIVARIKKVRGNELVLVCPKRCLLFSDSINLKLLKKQCDLLGKKIDILTMDERGQAFAKEVGFDLKFLPKGKPKQAGVSDIQINRASSELPDVATDSSLLKTVKNVTNFVTGLVGKSEDKDFTGKEASPEKVIVTTNFDYRNPNQQPKEDLKKTYSSENKKEKINIQKTSINVADDRGPGSSKNRTARIISLVCVLAVCLVFALVFVVLPNALITVFPKTEAIIRDFDANLDVQIKEPDAGKLILPAKKISENLSLGLKFQSQGKKDVGTKSSGMVRIYNFTGQILNLKSETTTLSVAGKNFKLTENAMQIKPVRYKNQQTKEIDPKTLAEPMEVVAMGGGDDYNFPSGLRLEISNSVLGSKPLVLYAKTETPITGGATRFLSVVTEADFNNAREEMGKQLISELKKQYDEQGMMLLDNAYSVEVIEFVIDKKVGTESPNFDAKINLKLEGLVFFKEHLFSMVKERIASTLSEGRTLSLDKGQGINVKLRNVDLGLNSATLSIHLESKTYPNLNLNQIKEKLIGKKVNVANDILQSLPEIEKVEVTVSPTWQKTFPWLKSKINLEIVND